jgi:hypothetical protein
MKTVAIGLGDIVTMAKAETLVTGRVDGMTAFKGQATAVRIEELDQWLDVNNGWQVIEKIEEENEI